MDWLFLLGVSIGDSVYFSGASMAVQLARDDVRSNMRQDSRLSRLVQIIDRDETDNCWYEYASRLAETGKNEGQIMVFVDKHYVDGTMPASLHGCLHAHAHFWPDGQVSVIKRQAPVITDDVLKLMLGRRL